MYAVYLIVLFLQCFNLAEQYEDVIETWYYHKQDQHLLDYLCSQRYLSKVKWDKCKRFFLGDKINKFSKIEVKGKT